MKLVEETNQEKHYDVYSEIEYLNVDLIAYISFRVLFLTKICMRNDIWRLFWCQNLKKNYQMKRELVPLLLKQIEIESQICDRFRFIAPVSQI